MNSTAPAGDSESGSTIAVEAFIIALAVVSVALRFYTRISSKAGLWWDDWMIFIAVVSTVITAVVLLIGKFFMKCIRSRQRKASL